MSHTFCSLWLITRCARVLPKTRTCVLGSVSHVLNSRAHPLSFRSRGLISRTCYMMNQVLNEEWVCRWRPSQTKAFRTSISGSRTRLQGTIRRLSKTERERLVSQGFVWKSGTFELLFELWLLKISCFSVFTRDQIDDVTQESVWVFRRRTKLRMIPPSPVTSWLSCDPDQFPFPAKNFPNLFLFKSALLFADLHNNVRLV